MKEKLKSGYTLVKKNSKNIGYVWLLLTLIYAIFNKLYLTTDNIVTYGETKIVDQVETVSVSKIIVMLIAYSFSVFAINWKNKLSPRIEKFIIILITVLSPLITFMFVELTFQSEIMNMEGYAIFFNLFIIAFFSWIFIVICNRFRPAIIIPLSIWFVFQIANLYVTRFRGFSLLMSDFTLIESAMTVASSYDYMVSYKMLIMAIALVDFFIIVCKLDNMRFFEKKVRVVAIFSALAYCGIFYWVTMESDLISEPRIHISQYKPQKSYRKNGTALTLFGSMQFLETEEPKGYNKENLNNLIQKYASDSKEDFEADKAPNVIVIMDEAFSDYETLYNLDTTEATLPFFSSLKENVVEGNMYVSIHGGQTANTEYEFLTGNSKAFLPYGVAPYQSYLKKGIKHLSLARSFKTMGYEQALALHSYGESGYNRVAAYDALGFDKFYTKDDFENPLYIRKFISDYSHFEKIIELYEENKKNYNSPFFMFNVTMQNHSSYSDIFENLDLNISVNNPEYAQKITLKTYLNLIKETDNAYKYLIEYFSEQEEPTMIVFFGDHQPSVNMHYDSETALQKYIVPFKIWTNYDIEEEYIDMISPNYLGVKVMEMVGGSLTGYQKFLLDMYKEVPVLTYNGYIGNDGVLYEVNNEESPYYDKLEEYKILQYNNLLDEENTIEDFFYIK